MMVTKSSKYLANAMLGNLGQGALAGVFENARDASADMNFDELLIEWHDSGAHLTLRLNGNDLITLFATRGDPQILRATGKTRIALTNG